MSIGVVNFSSEIVRSVCVIVLFRLALLGLTLTRLEKGSQLTNEQDDSIK